MRLRDLKFYNKGHIEAIGIENPIKINEIFERFNEFTETSPFSFEITVNEINNLQMPEIEEKIKSEHSDQLKRNEKEINLYG